MKLSVGLLGIIVILALAVLLVTAILLALFARRRARQAEKANRDLQEEILRIVLGNLLGNAWKFTSNRDQAEIHFGREQNDGETPYFVRDNGAGFDMAYVGKLFGTFQRLHTAGEFEGTGIGLATVQRIVHRHGGRVTATAKVNEGATFYFTPNSGSERMSRTPAVVSV